MAKKRRTAAQKKATKKMLAANRKKRGKRKTKKRGGKKRRKKASKKKRSGVTYCLVSPVTLGVLSCHKSRSRAIDALSKKRTKYTPLVLTRSELKKVKENRPKRRRKKKVAGRRAAWNP